MFRLQVFKMGLCPVCIVFECFRGLRLKACQYALQHARSLIVEDQNSSGDKAAAAAPWRISKFQAVESLPVQPTAPIGDP